MAKANSFLESVARAYVSRYEEMTDFCFVFPNKRSGSFFLKHLSSVLGTKSILAPEVLDIASFVTRIADREAATRIDLLFRLYRIYAAQAGLTTELTDADSVLEFDRFAPWGEIVLGDFSEVEKYDVDADAIFENVRDYRNISSNFLTERQLEVIERYFGYRPAAADVQGFWKSIYESDDNSQIREKFVELWRMLPELFQALTHELEKDGLALEGTLYRRAMNRIADEERAALPWEHVVFVGFNMLSTTEASIFSQLGKLRDDSGDAYAEFFWDAVGPVIGRDSDSKGAAAKAMRLNIKNFPMPQWAAPFMAECDVKGMTPEITIMAAPSNSAQVKIAGDVVSQWLETMSAESLAEAKAAIVLPDENLLMPLLHSLPKELKAVNLTMGYPIRYTSITSFVYHLQRLQMRRRKWNDQSGYYYEDIRLLMSHPLIHVLTGSDTANKINTEIADRHLRVVTLALLEEYDERLARILAPIPRDADVKQIIDYLDSVLETTDHALDQNREGLRTLNSKLEKSQVAVYRMALSRLLQSVTRHGIKMGFISVFQLVNKLVGGEKVTFEGEPLAGLQVMGMLETRALDFDRLLVLSMNDKVMPRRSHRRTFIPDSLRRGYGMPLSSQPEELYSYYFYRLLSRAQSVNLVYDARAGEGMRSGGKSRFLLQLEMLYARDTVKHRNFTFELDTALLQPKPVEKTPAVMEKLAEFTAPLNKGRNLSASALMNYCQCQVKFYYKNVVNMNDDAPATDYIDPITQGNIVHEAMLKLYFPEDYRNEYLRAPQRIILTADDLTKKIEDTAAISREVRRAVNLKHYKLKGDDLDRPLTGTVEMVAERLERQIRSVMRHDRDIAPVELVGGEISANLRWKAGNAPEVNMRYAFDRVDMVGGKMRIVDYKTGSSHVEAREFDDVFNGYYKSKYLLQLMLYSLLLEKRVESENEPVPDDISMLIYDVNTIEEGAVEPKISRRKVSGHQQHREQFLEGMESVINEIFDESVPFTPTADEANCSFCTLKAFCGKS